MRSKQSTLENAFDHNMTITGSGDMLATVRTWQRVCEHWHAQILPASPRMGRSHGKTAMTVGGDVADGRAMAEAFDAVERDFGGVDVVVHTAGIMILAPLAEFDLDDLDTMIRTNVRGTFVVNQLAAQRVRSGGAIVNFSSRIGRRHAHLIRRVVGPQDAVASAERAVALRDLRRRSVDLQVDGTAMARSAYHRAAGPQHRVPGRARRGAGPAWGCGLPEKSSEQRHLRGSPALELAASALI